MNVHFILVCLLISLTCANQAKAAKFKLYHCQTTAGPVVVQDRPCAVTRMKSIEPGQQVKKRNKPAINNQQKHTPKTLAQASLSSMQNRSPQAFIDIVNRRNWPLKLTRNGHGWQLNVQVPGKNNSEQAGQLSVQYFRNPQATLNQDSFSYALDLYHEIRHQYRLIDSRFKSHPNYKIFNIAYHKAQLSAHTEFYMGKFDESLWVFSLQSHVGDLHNTRHLMAQLQALMSFEG